MAELAQSVKEFGVIQPVIVRPVGTEYRLIAGERRWRAAQEADLDVIPAIIRESTEMDSLEIALIENLHREDLNGIEEANAYQQLLEDFGITHEELSRRLGKSRSAISNTLRLLGLPPALKTMVADGALSGGHARALLALGDPETQERLAKKAIKGGLSVRQLEELVRRAKEEGTSNVTRKRELPPAAQRVVKKLEEYLDTRVRVSVGKRKGRIRIEFTDTNHLEGIYRAIVGDDAKPRRKGK